MKHIIKTIGLLLLGLNIHAQYQLNISYSKPKDTMIYFRVYTFDEKLYLAKDTVKFINNKATISSTTPIYGGIYYLQFPSSGKRIQVCLDNKDIINLKINGDLPDDSIQCDDAENNVFLKYQWLERSFEYIDSQYNELQKHGKASLKAKEELYRKKREALTSFRVNALKTLNAKSMLHRYFTILNQIDAYKPEKQEFQGRDAFINQFNLKDQQVYFSPVIKQILYEYLSAYPLVADSIKKGMDVILSKLNCKDKAYPNTFNYFASILQNSSIKENMKGYTSLIEKYLINNTCQFLPKSKADEFINNYHRICDIAKTDTVINLTLKDTSFQEQELSTYISQYDYTVISFYDPSCEHCKYQMPELDSTLKVIRTQTGKTILNFAICNTSAVMEKAWKEFINEHKMNEHYVHVILGDDNTIRYAYAAYSNPLFYLCDRKGNILIKKASIAAIRKFLQRS